MAGNLNARTASYLSKMMGHVRKLWKESPTGATNVTLRRLKHLLNTLQQDAEPATTWPSYPGEQAQQSVSVLDAAQGPVAVSSDSESECTHHSKHCRSLAAETRPITFEDVQRVRAIYKRPAAEMCCPKTTVKTNIMKHKQAHRRRDPLRWLRKVRGNAHSGN